MSTTAMVKAEGVHKRFGRLEVLRGITLDVGRGEVMCIIGPSGSGKSTFLRTINHLEKINSGRLWVDGELVGYRERAGKLHELRDAEVAKHRTEIGMVFQRFNLFPHKTAMENVIEAPRLVRRVPKAQAIAQATALLERVGLADKLASYPSQLSGGQQQRVAIARSARRTASASASSRAPARSRRAAAGPRRAGRGSCPACRPGRRVRAAPSHR